MIFSREVELKRIETNISTDFNFSFMPGHLLKLTNPHNNPILGLITYPQNSDQKKFTFKIKFNCLD